MVELERSDFLLRLVSYRIAIGGMLNRISCCHAPDRVVKCGLPFPVHTHRVLGSPGGRKNRTILYDLAYTNRKSA
jgi:hypothetical protein